MTSSAASTSHRGRMGPEPRWGPRRACTVNWVADHRAIYEEAAARAGLSLSEYTTRVMAAAHGMISLHGSGLVPQPLAHESALLALPAAALVAGPDSGGAGIPRMPAGRIDVSTPTTARPDDEPGQLRMEMEVGPAGLQQRHVA